MVLAKTCSCNCFLNFTIMLDSLLKSTEISVCVTTFSMKKNFCNFSNVFKDYTWEHSCILQNFFGSLRTSQNIKQWCNSIQKNALVENGEKLFDLLSVPHFPATT